MEKMKKSCFSKCKTKTLKRFSSNYNTLCDGSKLFQTNLVCNKQSGIGNCGQPELCGCIALSAACVLKMLKCHVGLAA